MTIRAAIILLPVAFHLLCAIRAPQLTPRNPAADSLVA